MAQLSEYVVASMDLQIVRNLWSSPRTNAIAIAVLKSVGGIRRLVIRVIPMQTLILTVWAPVIAEFPTLTVVWRNDVQGRGQSLQINRSFEGDRQMREHIL